MAENQNFRCTGNCLNCLPAQRTYCAAQHSYSNMKVLDTMMGVVLDLKEKIEAMQNNEATLFDPTDVSDTAQSGDGAIE